MTQKESDAYLLKLANKEEGGKDFDVIILDKESKILMHFHKRWVTLKDAEKAVKKAELAYFIDEYDVMIVGHDKYRLGNIIK